MQSAEIAHESAADHDVVEVRDYKVSVGDVNVDSQRGQKEAGQSAHREQTEEAESVEHGRVVADGSLVQGGGPVEHFDGGGHGDGVAKEGKYKGGVDGDCGNGHVMHQ